MALTSVLPLGVRFACVGQNCRAQQCFTEVVCLCPAGNLDTCNYVEGTDTCYFLDNASSGVRIIGGVCLRTWRGVKTNTGKK